MSLFCFPLSVKGIVTMVTWNCEQNFSLYTFLTTESYELVCIYWNMHYLFFLNKGFFKIFPDEFDTQLDMKSTVTGKYGITFTEGC